MRPICILGILSFFAPLGIYFVNYRAIFITINGLIYHSNEHNRFLRIYDLTANITIIIYTCIINFNTIKYALFSTVVYIANNILHDRQKILPWQSDIIHVFGIHMPLAYALCIDCLRMTGQSRAVGCEGGLVAVFSPFLLPLNAKFVLAAPSLTVTI